MLRLVGVILVVFCTACSENLEDKYANKKPQEVNPKEWLIQEQRKLVKEDSLTIEDFIKQRTFNMTQTGTGLRYEITRETKLQPVQSEDRIELAYMIQDLKGDTLYASETSGLMTLDVDVSHAESGLHELVKYMKRGESARAILPSHLAYGLAGDDYKIPPFTILFFEIEILS